MRIHHFIVSATAVAAVWGGAVHAQSFEAPKLDIGDKWTYSYEDMGEHREPYTYTNQVFKADGESGWMYGESQAPQPWRKSWVMRYDFQRGGVTEFFEYNAPSQSNPHPVQPGHRYSERLAMDDDIQYPLFVGKKYTVDWPSVDGSSAFQFDVTVESFEKVVTPAGQFDAYKLKFVGHWQLVAGTQSYTGSARRVSWVAPAVKRIVRTEYQDRSIYNNLLNRSVEELVKWEPKAPVPAGLQ